MDIVFASLNLFCTLLYWWVLVTPVITPVMESALSPVSRRLSSTSYFDGAPFPFDFWLGLASRRNQQRLENMRGEVGYAFPGLRPCRVVGWQKVVSWKATVPS